MIQLKQINSEKVRPIPVQKIDNSKIKGCALFPEIYSNIFLVARKKSGKTSVIWKILKSCAGRDTKIIIFASTLYKDPNLIHIVNYFENKGNEVETYTSLKDDEGNNILSEVLDRLKLEDIDEQNEDDQSIKFVPIDFGDDERKEKSRRKEKFISPEYIIVFDDLGNELRNPYVNQLLKTNRHYKSKVIISSQHVTDISPESRKQIDFWILFGGHKEEKLKTIYDDADINIPFELFVKLYENATKQKYSFLYVDSRDVTFRKGFNYLYNFSQ